MPVFRKLYAHEHDLLADHLLRLAPSDRAMRFLGGVGEAYLRRHAREALRPGAIVVGCFEDGRLCGVAELFFIRDGGRRSAELALTVEAGRQGHGIGSTLFRHALVAARNRGIDRLHLACLPENRRMQHIARKAGCEVKVEAGEVIAEIGLPAATPETWLAEWQAESSAAIGASAEVCKSADAA